MLMLIYQ